MAQTQYSSDVLIQGTEHVDSEEANGEKSIVSRVLPAQVMEVLRQRTTQTYGLCLSSNFQQEEVNKIFKYFTSLRQLCLDLPIWEGLLVDERASAFLRNTHVESSISYSLNQLAKNELKSCEDDEADSDLSYSHLVSFLTLELFHVRFQSIISELQLSQASLLSKCDPQEKGKSIDQQLERSSEGNTPNPHLMFVSCHDVMLAQAKALVWILKACYSARYLMIESKNPRMPSWMPQFSLDEFAWSTLVLEVQSHLFKIVMAARPLLAGLVVVHFDDHSKGSNVKYLESELSKALAEVQSLSSHLKSQSDEYRRNITSQQQFYSDHILQLERHLEKEWSEIVAKKVQVMNNTHNKSIEDHQKKLMDLKAEVRRLFDGLSTAQANNAEVKSRLEVSSKELGNVRSELKEKVSALEAQSQELQTIRHEYALLAGQLKSTQSELETTKKSQALLQSELEFMNKRPQSPDVASKISSTPTGFDRSVNIDQICLNPNISENTSQQSVLMGKEQVITESVSQNESDSFKDQQNDLLDVSLGVDLDLLNDLLQSEMTKGRNETVHQQDTDVDTLQNSSEEIKIELKASQVITVGSSPEEGLVKVLPTVESNSSSEKFKEPPIQSQVQEEDSKSGSKPVILPRRPSPHLMRRNVVPEAPGTNIIQPLRSRGKPMPVIAVPPPPQSPPTVRASAGVAVIASDSVTRNLNDKFTSLPMKSSESADLKSQSEICMRLVGGEDKFKEIASSASLSNEKCAELFTMFSKAVVKASKKTPVKMPQRATTGSEKQSPKSLAQSPYVHSGPDENPELVTSGNVGGHFNGLPIVPHFPYHHMSMQQMQMMGMPVPLQMPMSMPMMHYMPMNYPGWPQVSIPNVRTATSKQAPLEPHAQPTPVETSVPKRRNSLRSTHNRNEAAQESHTFEPTTNLEVVPSLDEAQALNNVESNSFSYSQPILRGGSTRSTTPRASRQPNPTTQIDGGRVTVAFGTSYRPGSATPTRGMSPAPARPETPNQTCSRTKSR